MKLPRFGVEEWLNVHEKNAKYDIAGVSIKSLSLDELFELTNTSAATFYKELGKTKLDYGWIEGSPGFKKSVSQLYRTIEPEHILQTNGATGANFLALFSLIEPGDHIISLYPTYQQLYDIPKSLGAELEYWQIKEELNWLPDLDDLRQLIRPQTKMICLNNANNPTGAVMDDVFLKEVATIAASVGAYVLVDEVYTSFSENNNSSIVDLYENGIAVNSLSKTYSLAGIRIGWVAANEKVISILRDYRDYTLICAGVFDDMVAQLALENRQAIWKRNHRIIHENLSILDHWVSMQPRASYIKPAFVSTSFVKLDVPIPIEEFSLNLLEKYGVLVVPGSRFEKEGYVRIGYACDQETLKKGLELLGNALAAYDKSH